jgi:hypothetical protein
MKKRKPMWLTKMYWGGPFVDLTGKSITIRIAWAYRLKQFVKRILTLRKGKRLIADIFFTLWVFMDVLALIKGTVPLLPLSIWGAIFGCLLVAFEWIIFREEYMESAPLHVLWQPRYCQPPMQPFLYVHFESKNNLPFEVRCTFTNDKNVVIGACPSGYEEFVPTESRKCFAYSTQILRTSLNGLRSLRLHVEIASLTAHPKLHDRWISNFALDEASGKFKHASGPVGMGDLTTQTWWYPEEQDEEWLRWEQGL